MFAASCKDKRALVLVTDAYGGHGGIAKFNRDLLTSVAAHPGFREVIALPRVVAADFLATLPSHLRFQVSAAKSKISYLMQLIKELLRNRTFHAVICGHIHLLPLAWWASRLAKAPLVQICHGLEAWAPTSRWFTDRIVKEIDYLISVSELTRDRFQSWTSVKPKSSFILPNCVDLGQFQPQPRNPALVERYQLYDKTVLLTLGRLERSKGIDEVLELLSRMHQPFRNVVYLIVGGGSDLARLKEKSRVLGLADRVVFTGCIEESQKVSFYNLADVFVMPGHGEGFGIVYLEAMACGVPTVGSVLDGSREALLGGKLGVLVNPGDPASLEAGILEALARGKGIPQGLEYFSKGRFHERLLHILDALHGRPLHGEAGE
jgi:phosphatidylinositol alpha-1,6-mannosyltransferase